MAVMSRRSFLRLGGLGLFAAPLLAACGGATPAAPTAAPAAPVKPAESKPAAPAPAAPAPAAPAAPAASPAAQAAPASVPAKTAADAAFDWKQFRGETINMLFIKHPWATVVEENLKDFEELTGIKVQWEDLPEIQGRQKLAAQFAGGGASVDAFQASLHVEKVQFSKSGWFLPLDELIADKKLISPEFDWNDFAPPGRDAATYNGKIIALPIFVDVSIMAYRKDLLAQKGIQPPQDHKELEEAVKALHNPPQVYGWCARGLKNANMTQWPCQFFNFGGKYVENGKAAINSEGGTASVDWYARMNRTYAPPGVVNFNWSEVTAAFLQGQVAFMEDGINFFTQYEDETKSRVKGQVAYTLVPKGPAGQVPPTYTPAMAVASNTKKPGPAFLFAQWATGKSMGIKAQLGGVGVARLSTWEDPKVKESQKMPTDWVNAFIEGNRVGKPGLPEIAAVTQYRDEVGAILQKAIEGGDSVQIANEMNVAFQAVLDKEPA
jgi:multiple sugar transport system substrate-binding protein